MPKYDNFMDIATILNDYSKQIYQEINEDSKVVAKEGAIKLRKTSPKRTGKYRKGWRVKSSENQYGFSSIIYNSTNWQLTHLLEKGHAKRNGGRVSAKVHIRPVEQQCNEKYYQDVVNIIKKGA